jgi:hypothetical protein
MELTGGAEDGNCKLCQNVGQLPTQGLLLFVNILYFVQRYWEVSLHTAVPLSV